MINRREEAEGKLCRLLGIFFPNEIIDLDLFSPGVVLLYGNGSLKAEVQENRRGHFCVHIYVNGKEIERLHTHINLYGEARMTPHTAYHRAILASDPWFQERMKELTR
jgi:hypothetical protein